MVDSQKTATRIEAWHAIRVSRKWGDEKLPAAEPVGVPAIDVFVADVSSASRNISTKSRIWQD
jgi:hypothetical protein